MTTSGTGSDTSRDRHEDRPPEQRAPEKPPVFTEENLRRAQQIVAKYERPMCALLPVLYIAQDQFGYLSPAVMNYVADLLQMPRGHVYDAASFYTMFKKSPTGKWCVQVCHNVTCTMMGAEAIIEAARETLGIGVNGTTEDKLFTLQTVECLGSCDKAPVVQINNEFVEREMSAGALKELIARMRSEGEKVVDEVTG